MKKWLSLIMVLAILVCVTACGAKPDASDKNNEDEALKKTGKYNGQTITMTYTVTDVEYPSDMRSITMQQGYAAFYDYTFKNSTTGTNTYSGDTWNFLDRNGNRVLSEPYTELESFNKNGVAVAQKMDGTYVRLNTKLEETPITEQEYLDFCLDANNTACNQTYPRGEGRYSCLENGLAIYVEYVDGKAYAGLVDKNGTVIIKAYIPISYSEMVERLHLSEGVAFVEDAATSHIGMISVVRSSDASEGNGTTATTVGTTTTAITTTTTTTKTTATTATAAKHTTTKKTTVDTNITLSTNPYTAADLFFPLDSPSITPPKSATMTDASVAFDDAQRRVRLQLPVSLTVKTAKIGGHTYAALYHGEKRVGRLLVNYIYPDVEAGTDTGETVTIGGVDVQTMCYPAGAEEATTYYSFFIDSDSFFYTLEISTDYISQTDFAACFSSMQIIELLARNNRLDCRNKDGLRIAIAGNSFISYSEISGQLKQLLQANGKNATVNGYSYPNTSVSQIVADPQKMALLCGGNYDILFISSAYYSEDVSALSVMEEACNASGTELVLFPAHNEGEFNTERAYLHTQVKLAPWKTVLDKLLTAGVAESDLIYNDNVRHSKPLAGYCGAVMIYGMLYESAPNTASFGASYCRVPEETAQQVENITMNHIRPYFE
ncbi:MAG: hypothetical protein IJN04_07195 [Clostridia bacterium]|nr:hypothetical protein [Clostridia bacterium]